MAERRGDGSGVNNAWPLRAHRPNGMPSLRGTGAFANVRQFPGKIHGGHVRTRPFWFNDFLSSSLTLPDTLRDTSAAGSPTFAQRADIANGVWRVTLESTSEAQLVGFDWADQRMIPANRAWEITGFISVPASLATNEGMVFGVYHDYNATLDNVSHSAWFRIVGGSSGLTLVAEADNNTTDVSASTGVTITANTMYHYSLIYKPNGRLEWWLDDNRIYETGLAFDGTILQPVFLLTKSTGTTTPTLDIDYYYVDWDRF